MTADGLAKNVQALSVNLQNRTFVDYFNTFLCLPVFGQHVIYNHTQDEFKFEPPIDEGGNSFLDPREIMFWMCRERLELFEHSALFTEYQLSMKLQSADIELPEFKHEDQDGDHQRTFTENLIGTVTGMMLFRESLRGTNGEQVYRCWKDIQAWKLISDPGRKVFWKRAIKTKYIYKSSSSKVNGSLKVIAFQGSLNFGLVDADVVDNDRTDIIYGKMEVHTLDTTEALLHVQVILFRALRKYWFPRYVLHILKTTPQRILAILKRPVREPEHMDLERKISSKFMFPTIYQDPKNVSSNTTVSASKSTGDLHSRHLTAKEVSEGKTKDCGGSKDNPNHQQLLTMWGGPTKEVTVKEKRSTSSLSYFSEKQDDVGKQKPRPRSHSAAPKLPKTTVPIEVKSFLGGKKRTLLGQYPNTTNRVVWALASDILAACPFRKFLQLNEYALDINYLNFWTDIRSFLDADEHAVNELGQPLRKILAQGILQKYLSRNHGDIQLFSKSLKKDICKALQNKTDVSLICMAQDIVQESLWEPLKTYMDDERKRFLAQVRGVQYGEKREKQKSTDDGAEQSKGNSKQRASSATYGESPTKQRGSVKAKSTPLKPVYIKVEQMWKATELAILCCEYGSPMMVPQYPPAVHQLIDILEHDYGSLYQPRPRVPTVRNKWVRDLVDPPKIDIESIRVSREVCLDEVNTKALSDLENAKSNRRRNGMTIDRPQKPKSFIEVLTSENHFGFFKRFLMSHKMVLPLMFWKAVEDIKVLVNIKTRQMRVPQIMRTFFPKNSKSAVLMDCHEEIIRQIPKIDKVTPAILICAQAAVFRSMERKWYQMYLDTYPPEIDIVTANRIEHEKNKRKTANRKKIILPPRDARSEMFDEEEYAQNLKEKYKGVPRYQFRMWRKLSMYLKDFMQSLNSKHDIQLLTMYLKCEIEKEHIASLDKEHVNSKFQPLEKNMMLANVDSQNETRVVIQNRMVILNRLPADLMFWVEVRKYQILVDSTNHRMSAQYAGYIYDKAVSIISCYLNSDVPPKVQVNIPNDMAHNIITTLGYYGPIRGLFHEALILLFPVLYHYYKKFQHDVHGGLISDEYLETFENMMRRPSCTSPHPGVSTPDFNDIVADEILIFHREKDEPGLKIHFSLSEGISYIYPKRKPGLVTSRQIMSLMKGSFGSLTAITAAQKPSTIKSTPEEKGDGHGRHRVKAGDSQHNIKKAIKPAVSLKKKNMNETRKKHEKAAKNENNDKTEKGKESEKAGKFKKIEKAEKTEIFVKRKSEMLTPSEAKLRMSERARRMNTLLESMNKEKQRQLKKRKKNKYKYVMSFADVVQECMNKLTHSNAIFT